MRKSPKTQRVSPTDFRKYEAAFAQYRAYTQRVEKAVRTTAFDSEEAAIVQWLCEPQIDWAPLRARFDHALASVDDSTLRALRALIVMTCEGLRENDSVALQSIAAKAHEMHGRSTMNDRIDQAFSVIEPFLARARNGVATASDAAFAHYLLVQIEPGFARNGFSAELLARAQELAAQPRRRGLPTAPALLAWAMFRTGAFGATSEATAKEVLNNARRVRRRKK